MGFFSPRRGSARALTRSVLLVAGFFLSEEVLAVAGKIPTAQPMYDAVPAFGGLKFHQAVQVVYAPSDDESTFVVERTGRVAVVRDELKPQREIFLDLSNRLKPTDNEGLLSMAFHPRFTENGYFYVWYSLHVRGVRADRLSRFQRSASNPAIADANSELPLLTQATGQGGHDGGMLLFGPDGYLYLSLGDGDEHLSEPDLTHQRIDRSFFGAILRLDVDQRPGSLRPNPHPAVHVGTYAIPPDNPFVGATSFAGAAVKPVQVRTEFWAFGLRNPWRLDFDPATGRLWCGDVGLHEREEVDIIVRGGNYGWNYREGTRAGNRGRAPAGAQFVDPIWEYDHAIGLSVTGGIVYRGKNFPELEGKYLCGDYVLGKIWALSPDGEKPVGNERVVQIAKVPGAVSFARDPKSGDPLIASFTENKIYRLVPTRRP